MPEDKNAFGGIAGSLYVPMSEDEQEVLDRLIQADDLEVHVIGWGVLHTPKVKLGDKRLGIHFKLSFNAPALPIPVHYFDLELRTRSGLVLHAERQPTLYGAPGELPRPLQIQAGMELEMIWDIAIDRISPAIVKMIKPGATGLTSRFTDRDTGDLDRTGGNMNLSGDQKAKLRQLNEARVKITQYDKQKIAKATAKEDALVKSGKLRKLDI